MKGIRAIETTLPMAASDRSKTTDVLARGGILVFKTRLTVVRTKIQSVIAVKAPLK
jgi:hypothetical protein